jgi:hypothetical protein
MRLVAGLADLGSGRVVCHPTPHDPSGAWLAIDLLITLGKRLDAPALERLGHGRYRWRLAGVWLRAEDVGDLFVVRAHLLSGPALARLVAQRQACGHRLWLIVHQATLGRAQQRALDLDPAGWCRHDPGRVRRPLVGRQPLGRGSPAGAGALDHDNHRPCR